MFFFLSQLPEWHSYACSDIASIPTTVTWHSAATGWLDTVAEYPTDFTTTPNAFHLLKRLNVKHRSTLVQ